MELWPCGFKIDYTHLGFASAGAFGLGIWNSDHVVLKLIIRTSASPRQQRSHWGLRVTQDAYFSLLTHTKQLLLVTFCDMLAGIEVSFWTDGTTEGWSDRRGNQNSYLDSCWKLKSIPIMGSLLVMCWHQIWAHCSNFAIKKFIGSRDLNLI